MKTFTLFFASAAFMFSGCSQQPTSQSEPIAQTSETTPTAEIAPTNEPTQQKQLTIDEFLAAFKAKGIKGSKGHNVKIKKEPGVLFGAKESLMLDMYSGSIRVIEFDTSITSGREAMEKLRKDGFMGQAFLFNKNLAIAKYLNVPQWSQVKEVFESL
jgi:hypothetical protein